MVIFSQLVFDLFVFHHPRVLKIYMAHTDWIPTFKTSVKTTVIAAPIIPYFGIKIKFRRAVVARLIYSYQSGKSVYSSGVY